MLASECMGRKHIGEKYEREESVQEDERKVHWH